MGNKNGVAHAGRKDEEHPVPPGGHLSNRNRGQPVVHGYGLSSLTGGRQWLLARSLSDLISNILIFIVFFKIVENINLLKIK